MGPCLWLQRFKTGDRGADVLEPKEIIYLRIL